MDKENKPLICGCVEDSTQMLKLILSMYTNEWSGIPAGVYLSLEKYNVVCKEVGEMQLELILTLLDRMGFIGHSGSLTSSSYLTEKGLRLREKLAAEPTS